MAGPSKEIRVSDEILCELLLENEYSDISKSEYSSDSEMKVKISSSGEQCVNSNEEENVSVSSNMQHDICLKSDAERPRFPFTGKPGINVGLEDPTDSLEYFELFVLLFSFWVCIENYTVIIKTFAGVAAMFLLV
jgi:hypothetical protein